MGHLTTKTKRRDRIRKGIRKKISGTLERPRLSVYRSNSAIYAQIIDDATAHTLIAANSKMLTEKITPVQQAIEVGKLLAQKAQEKNITSVVFDRGGYLYHGRVKALADGAREGGLQF